MKIILSAIIFSLLLGPALAKEAESLEDPVYQDRFKALTQELRCLKCQNQTIYDSKAGLADDLRRQITEQMHAGKNDQEIIDYMVTRYGDFIRYRPDIKVETLFLWAGPFIFLIIGVTMLVVQIRKRRNVVEDAPLTADEAKRVQALMENPGGDKH